MRRATLGDMDDPGRHRLRRDRLPWVRKLRALRLVSVVASFALAAACDNTIPLDLPPRHCASHYIVEPAARPVVVSLGGSRRLHVRLQEIPESYSHCSRMSPEWFRWSISNPSVAEVDRVDEYSGAVVTITGLAVGRTWIKVQYGALWQTETLVPLEVEEPMEDEARVGLSLRATVVLHGFERLEHVDGRADDEAHEVERLAVRKPVGSRVGGHGGVGQRDAGRADPTLQELTEAGDEKAREPRGMRRQLHVASARLRQ